MADYSADPLRQMVQKRQAMPAPGQSRPGRFPVKNQTDLENAIRAVGRVSGGEPERQKVRKFIIARAKALKLGKLIPDTWNADGSLKSSSN